MRFDLFLFKAFCWVWFSPVKGPQMSQNITAIANSYEDVVRNLVAAYTAGIGSIRSARLTVSTMWGWRLKFDVKVLRQGIGPLALLTTSHRGHIIDFILGDSARTNKTSTNYVIIDMTHDNDRWSVCPSISFYLFVRLNDVRFKNQYC